MVNNSQNVQIKGVNPGVVKKHLDEDFQKDVFTILEEIQDDSKTPSEEFEKNQIQEISPIKGKPFNKPSGGKGPIRRPNPRPPIHKRAPKIEQPEKTDTE